MWPSFVCMLSEWRYCGCESEQRWVSFHAYPKHLSLYAIFKHGFDAAGLDFKSHKLSFELPWMLQPIGIAISPNGVFMAVFYQWVCQVTVLRCKPCSLRVQMLFLIMAVCHLCAVFLSVLQFLAWREDMLGEFLAFHGSLLSLTCGQTHKVLLPSGQ